MKRLRLSPRPTSKNPPESGDWQFFLGKAFVLRGKHDEAKSAFGKAARSGSPLAIDAEMQLALLLKNLGTSPRVASSFSKVYDRASCGWRPAGSWRPRHCTIWSNTKSPTAFSNK